VTDVDDGRSMISSQSESGVHASQMGIPSQAVVGDGPQDGGQQVQKARKTKIQLWNDLKISGKAISVNNSGRMLIFCSDYSIVYTHIHSGVTNSSHSHTTQSSRSKKLSFQCGLACDRGDGKISYQFGKP
jgi:hypothetical protein